MEVIIQRSSDYLEHHGILGQKWGKKNGPPYPLDYEDHSSAEKKENTKGSLNNYENHNEKSSSSSESSKASSESGTSLKTVSSTSNDKKANALDDSKIKESTSIVKEEELKFRKDNSDEEKKSFHDRRKEKLLAKGMTEEEAEAQIKFENRAMAIAAVTAAAIGATAVYGVVRNQNMMKDFVLSSGKEMYRVASSDSSDLRDMFYATTNKLDAKKYAGMYANQKIKQSLAFGQSTDIYQKILSPKSDIKIAGAKTGKEVFEELYKNDPAFKNANFGLSYDAFNQHAIMQDKNSGETKKFFDALQAKGYGGVIDINDSKYSGYEATRPVILFNQQNNMNVNTVKKLTQEEIKNNNRIGSLVAAAQNYFSDTSTASVGIARIGTVALVKAGSNYVKSLDELDEQKQVAKK